VSDMLALRLESLAADWQVRRFNPNHAPPGAGGGQFTSGPQGGAQAAKQQKPQRAANARAARAKGNLLKRARADDAEAGKLEGQLKGLRAQQAQALAAAGRHRTAKAHHAKQHKAARQHHIKAHHAKAVAHHTSAAATAAATAAALGGQIAGLVKRIDSLRAQAKALRAQAAKL